MGISGLEPGSKKHSERSAKEGADRKKYTLEYLVAGSIAGIVSRTFIAPIERVKILYQITTHATSSRTGYLHLIPEIYQTEGVLAFWRGNTAAVIRVVPYMSITFLSYEQYKAALTAVGFSSNPCNLLAGSGAGMTAVMTTYPLDLVRARLAKQDVGVKSLKYRNMWDALVNIPREEGRQTGDGKIRIAALYRGLFATMIGEAPYAGLKFCMYEAMKRSLCDLWGITEQELSPLLRVSCGALSGQFTTAYATHATAYATLVRCSKFRAARCRVSSFYHRIRYACYRIRYLRPAVQSVVRRAHRMRHTQG